MAGYDDADAQPLAGRHRAEEYRPRHMRRHTPESTADAGEVDDVDEAEGPDEAELDAVNRLMGFLRGDDDPAVQEEHPRRGR